MSTDPATLALDVAERVSDKLAARGLRGALIGAAAMAIHGYTRATEDIDIGVVGAALDVLNAVAEELRADGFHVDVREPDADDPLGGLVRIEAGDELQIDVVNFGNPYTGASRRVGEFALSEPGVLIEGRRLCAVGLVPLMVLKLAGGSRFDLRDAAELLARHPEVDHDSLRVTCAALRLDRRLDRVLADLSSIPDDDPPL